MERESFIAAMIAALKENEALAQQGHDHGVRTSNRAGAVAVAAAAAFNGEDTEGGDAAALFRSSPPSPRGEPQPHALAHRAYTALQYDFPLCDDVALRALAELYRSLADGSEQDAALAATMALTQPLLESLAYLNDDVGTGKRRSTATPQGDGTRRRGSEASALLAAAVLLCIPHRCLTQPRDDRVSTALLAPLQRHSSHEAEALRMLAVGTTSSSFALVPRATWTEWRLGAALSTMATRMLYQSDDQQRDPDEEEEEDDNEKEERAPLGGFRGEWRRYVYLLRGQLLRQPGDAHLLQALLALVQALGPESSSSSSSWATQSSSDESLAATSTRLAIASAPQRVALRVTAEVAVSTEYAGPTAASHALAQTVLLPLVPLLVTQLETLAPLATRSDAAGAVSVATFAAHHGDALLVLLQLVHALLDQAAPSQRSALVERLVTSGLLRASLTVVPTVDADATDAELWTARPWLSPLLRLVGECALWHGEWASFALRVPRLVALVRVALTSAPAETLLLWLAALQHGLAFPTVAVADHGARPLPSSAWELLATDPIFPPACGSFLDAMHMLADTLFVLECVARALPVLQPSLLQELRPRLQRIYATRFASAFQYPPLETRRLANQAVAAEARGDQPDRDEETKEEEGEEGEEEQKEEQKEKKEEEEERGQAEALQFQALRNRLRQCIKTILLAPSSASGSSLGSSKLD